MDGLTTSDGRRLAYRRRGEGVPLVCHSGGPGFSALYLGELAGLDEQLDLVLLDPRGTGGSERPADPRAYTIEDYANDLEELRRHLGLDRINLFGHSHGGIVAIDYAARFPDRVERLVLANTLARFAEEQLGAMETAMVAKAAEPWYEDARAALEIEQAGEFETDEELGELARRFFPFYFAFYGDPERAYIESLRPDVPNADTLRLFNQEIFTTFDLRPELGRISAPTLVITGEEDFIAGPVCADEIEAGLHDVRKVNVPGAGHFVFVEAPRQFREAVLEFLAA